MLPTERETARSTRPSPAACCGLGPTSGQEFANQIEVRANEGWIALPGHRAARLARQPAGSVRRQHDRRALPPAGRAAADVDPDLRDPAGSAQPQYRLPRPQDPALLLARDHARHLYDRLERCPPASRRSVRITKSRWTWSSLARARCTTSSPGAPPPARCRSAPPARKKSNRPPRSYQAQWTYDDQRLPEDLRADPGKSPRRRI